MGSDFWALFSRAMTTRLKKYLDSSLLVCVLRFAVVSNIVLSFVTRCFSATGRRADNSMPLKESEAIVLRSFPLGEGDRLVSFLSRTEGRLRGVARGARKPKSPFGSTLEPLSYIRIWYYERETRDLVRINQCEILESFYAAQRDYSTSVSLAMVSEIVETVLPEHEASDPFFRLVLVVLRALSSGKGVQLPLAYFALWTVKLAGWLPSFERCQNCGNDFGAVGAFSLQTGELVCSNCRIGGEPIPGRLLAVGRKILSEKLESLLNTPHNDSDLKELLNYLLNRIEHESEHELSTRRMVTAEIET
jgi:DNA repair protein RecO (recombination protein O)